MAINVSKVDKKKLNKNQRKRLEVADKCGYRCWYCGRSFDEALSSTELFKRHSMSMLTVDHLVPLSRGGKDDDDNLVLSCVSCNSRKHSRTVDEYRFYLTWEKPGILSFLSDLWTIGISNRHTRELSKDLFFKTIETTSIVRFYGESDDAYAENNCLKDLLTPVLQTINRKLDEMGV